MFNITSDSAAVLTSNIELDGRTSNLIKLNLTVKENADEYSYNLLMRMIRFWFENIDFIAE